MTFDQTRFRWAPPTLYYIFWNEQSMQPTRPRPTAIVYILSHARIPGYAQTRRLRNSESYMTDSHSVHPFSMLDYLLHTTLRTDKKADEVSVVVIYLRKPPKPPCAPISSSTPCRHFCARSCWEYCPESRAPWLESSCCLYRSARPTPCWPPAVVNSKKATIVPA